MAVSNGSLLFFCQLHEKACFKAFWVLDDNLIDFIAKTRHRRS
nr:MAG TPA: hypothetical protein [Caudoviricetes sp.]